MNRLKFIAKEMLFAEIDGYNAIAMALVAGLAIVDGALILDDIVQYITKLATAAPVTPVF